MILKKRAALSNWHVITLFGAFLYLAYSFALLFDGRPNADEGWYLYAGRLVFQGAMPYRDFAYTQMPLLPYIYGVPQLIQPGILTGRLTSIFFSVAGLALWLRIAQRHGGGLAVALAALLLGTYTFGIYLQSIAKYFALVSFLFAATLSVLTSKGEWRYFFCNSLCYPRESGAFVRSRFCGPYHDLLFRDMFAEKCKIRYSALRCCDCCVINPLLCTQSSSDRMESTLSSFGSMGQPGTLRESGENSF